MTGIDRVMVLGLANSHTPILRHMMLSWKKRLLFSSMLLVGLVLIAEGALHALARWSPAVDAAISIDPVRPYAADRSLVWRGNPRYPEHDRAGFRNPDVPRDVAIVALGDSQTYGSHVAREQAWPKQLERLGKGPTYNMAFPGWGPPQSFLLVDDALALRPRLVVEALYAGNDLIDSFTFVYERNRLDRFKTSDPGVRRAIAAAERADPWDEDDGLLDQNPIDDDLRRKKRTPSELLVEQSRLVGLWHGVQRAYSGYRERLDDEGETGEPADDDSFRLQTARFTTVLAPSYRLTAVNLSDPRVREGLRITVDTLAAMQAQCREGDARFAVLLVPTKELALREVVEGERLEVPPAYRRLVDQEESFHQTLAAQLATRQILFVDALPSLRALVRQGELPYSATEDGHLNARGQRAVAELLSRTIDQQRLLAGGSPGASF